MGQHTAIWTTPGAVGERWGRRFTELDIPDEKERQRPAVDLLVEDDVGRHWVIEHTVVESFAGRIFDDSLFSILAKCVEEGLSGSIPKPGQYRVTLNPGGLTRRIDIDDICAAVHTWAMSVAGSLAIGSSPSRHPHTSRTLSLHPGR